MNYSLFAVIVFWVGLAASTLAVAFALPAISETRTDGAGSKRGRERSK